MADLDVAALEAAGFTKLTDADWQDMLDDSRKAYNNPNINIPYYLRRGDVKVIVQQNTFAAQPSEAVQTSTIYPAMVLVQGPRGQVACDPGNTKLILSLADEVA